MENTITSPREWSVGAKLSMITFALTAVVFSVFCLVLGEQTANLIEKQAINEVKEKTALLVELIDTFNRRLEDEVAVNARVFQGYFPNGITLDAEKTVPIAGQSVPVLKHGNAELNLDFSIPDKFTALTGVTATIFVKTGDDFIRISTSLKKEDGSRAVGTLLDRKHPGHARLLAGEAYAGMAVLFGKLFMTRYEPLKNAKGEVIGVLYVGADFSNQVTRIKEKIKAMKVGTTGYFFAFNAREGKDKGMLMVHPVKEGVNMLDSKDNDGRPFVREMLEKKNGMIRYSWSNSQLGESANREKVVSFAYVKNWEWVIAGGTFTDEITAEVSAIKNIYAALGLFMVLLMTGLLYPVIRQLVSIPLRMATVVAKQLATGDLTAHVTSKKSEGHDEIGELLHAMNDIGHDLSEIVLRVRSGTDAIAGASQEIVMGNADLSARSEVQAGSLGETAASMSQLTVAVKQNAGSADQANTLVINASNVAGKGGKMVSQVIDTMAQINASSRKIVDIIGVIDDIAFQTNILALNAAVEAARAGTQGRGFAVVATEVRNLAQRSASAAREIKNLINDSVEKADAGRLLANDTGKIMEEILTSVQRVTTIMGEIDTASREQSAGIALVNQAIGEMDDMTRQNAALVAQATSAADAMRDQANDLSGLVHTFKL